MHLDAHPEEFAVPMSRLTEFPMEGCPEEFAAQIDPFPEGPDTEKAKAAPVGEMIPPPTPPKGPGTGERAAPVGEMLLTTTHPRKRAWHRRKTLDATWC